MSSIWDGRDMPNEILWADNHASGGVEGGRGIGIGIGGGDKWVGGNGGMKGEGSLNGKERTSGCGGVPYGMVHG